MVALIARQGRELQRYNKQGQRLVVGAAIGQGYGLTETCAGGTFSEADDISVGRVRAPLPCAFVKDVAIEIRVNVNELPVEELSEAEYHQFKEEHTSSDHVTLVINQEHFDASLPRPSLPDQRGEVIICVSASNPPQARPDGGMRGGTESPITSQVLEGALLAVAFTLLAAKPEQQAGIPFLMDLYTASILVTVFTGILLIALPAVAAERAPPRLLAWARAVGITSLIMVAVLRLRLETSTPSLIRSVLIFIAMFSVAMAPPLLLSMFRRVFCTKWAKICRSLQRLWTAVTNA